MQIKFTSFDPQNNVGVEINGDNVEEVKEAAKAFGWEFGTQANKDAQ